jgi:hypothetical protein
MGTEAVFTRVLAKLSCQRGCIKAGGNSERMVLKQNSPIKARPTQRNT